METAKPINHIDTVRNLAHAKGGRDWNLPEHVTSMKVFGERPADVPADWPIMNAPRPLLGHKEWQGDFHHGRFYVAIDPADEMAPNYVKENLASDGWVSEHVGQEDIDAYAADMAVKYNLEPGDFTQAEARQSYFNRHGVTKHPVKVA